MFVVYEVFKKDGKRFFIYKSNDRFDCEVYVRNHDTCASYRGDSELIIEEREGEKDDH